MKPLTRRDVNRARLDRQWLLARRAADPIEAVERLVGLQAQQSDAPYYQLWSRLADFDVDDLSGLLTDRRVVRMALMRSTIHLVSAADCLRLRPVLQPYLDRAIFQGSYGKRLTGIDIGRLVAETESLLADGPLDSVRLGTGLAERFPGFDGPDLAYGARCALPLIQVPPRGVWGVGGGLRYASTSQFLSDVPDVSTTIDELVMRYLAAFGPARVKDFQVWSSLTRTAEVFARLRDRLTSYRDTEGNELFDPAGTELPDPDTEVRPILLGPFDNVLLSHADREWIISKPAQKRVFTHNGLIGGTLLLDGEVSGLWRMTSGKRDAVLRVERFGGWRPAERELVEPEALRLLRFAAEPSARTSVEFG